MRTTGTSQCNSGRSECRPPAESCNLQDDDCDGRCDEESPTLGCRIGVHRGYTSGFHIYSTSSNLISSQGSSVEVSNYFELYQDSVPDTSAVYLCLDQMQRASLSTSRNCSNGQAPLEHLGYWANSSQCGARPLYSLVQPESGNTFYTIDPAEVDNAMETWSYQNLGIVGYVW